MACSLWAGDVCRVAGSDWLASSLGSTLPVLASKEEITLDLQLSGSAPALMRVRSGEVDMALVVMPEKQDLGPDWQVLPFAFEVALIGVHVDNPLKDISYPQLIGIFGASKTENINRWSEMGLSGSWMSRMIQPMMPAQDRGTSILFDHIVLDGRELKPTVRSTEDLHDLMKRVELDESAIAVLPFTSGSQKVQLLSVSTGKEESVPFFPNEETIYYGDYPLRSPIYLVIPVKANTTTKKMVQLLYSEAVAQRLIDGGVCPLPKKVRKRTLLGLDFES